MTTMIRRMSMAHREMAGAISLGRRCVFDEISAMAKTHVVAFMAFVAGRAYARFRSA